MQAMQLAKCPSADFLEKYLGAELSDLDIGRIDSHIDHCSACRSAVEELLSDSDDYASLGQLIRQQTDPPPGMLPDFVGPYWVQGELGRGAYGIVYQGHDATLERTVAVKVPFARIVKAAGGPKLYLNEARILAQLDHPAIVRIYEAAVDHNGQCYVASQFVRGQDLDAFLRQGRYDVRTAASLVARIAEALQHAHERDIWHRDIKPANILLNERQEPFLADFGLALQAHEIGTGPHFAGTPAYMSPEQARGDGHRVDGRTDIYSLGVVFYKLLTGRRPFQTNSVDDLLDLIVQMDIPPVRQRDRSIPRELDRICSTALERDPTRRYATAGDLADDLNKWLSRQSYGLANHADQSVATAIHGTVTAAKLSSDTRSIGGFQLRGVLGVGGMGIVHRAWQPSAERFVALKCLAVEDEASKLRFVTEIRALGKVSHPNLVQIYTSGVDQNRFYYAMELIEGTGFRRLLQSLDHQHSLDEDAWQQAVAEAADHPGETDVPTSASDAWSQSVTSSDATGSPDFLHTGDAYRSQTWIRRMAAMIRDVARATHALHDAGIIHRDIKPDNILIDRELNRAVLMDLGVARLSADAASGVTRTRQFVGSVRYASPEQILSARDVDCRTDIYSLGATLWELLSVRPLYGIDNSVSDSQAMLRIEISEPGPLRQCNPAVPADLESITQKCLEKSPEHRYESAADLADDLDRFLTQQPVAARPVSILRRGFRRIRRRPMIPALLMLIAVLGLFLLAAWIPEPVVPSNTMRIGIKPWVGFSPLVVAARMGLCEDTHIELVSVRSTSDVRRRILSRELDIAPYLVDSHAIAQADRVPTRAILQLDVSLTADAMIVVDDIKSFADLRNRRIAYMHHEAPHFLLLSLCEKHRLETTAFQHIKTETVQEAVQRFVDGQADAVVAYEPFLSQALERPDTYRMASAADDPGSIIDILTVHNDYLQQQPRRVTALIRAWMAGLELLKNGAPQALQIACEFLGTDEHPVTIADYFEMTRGMQYGGIRENVRFFRRDADGVSECHRRLTAAQDRWDRHQQLSRRTDPRDSDRSDLLLELYDR